MAPTMHLRFVRRRLASPYRTATDVAKSAAGVVLTEAGLGGIVAAVKEGRVTFQRILSYALRSTIAKITQVLLLAVGLVMTGHAVLTPMLMVIVMITGDFLAMSLTTDRVRPSGEAELMENRQDYDSKRHSGPLLSGVLYDDHRHRAIQTAAQRK